MKRAGPLASGAAIALATAACGGLAGQAESARASEQAGQCASDGDLQLICGQNRPEDLVLIPGTDWVVVSWLAGGIAAINADDKTTRPLFPAANVAVDFDRERYADCPGPLASADPASFAVAGLAIRPDGENGPTLYAVRVGDEAAIHVLDLEVGADGPVATWRGCVPAEEKVFLNSVAPLPGGGFAATNFVERGPGYDAARVVMEAGGITGEVREWHPGRGWSIVPGSELSGANGIEALPDGSAYIVDAWGGQSVVKLPRTGGGAGRVEMPVGVHMDNIHFTPDGTLLATGHGGDRTLVIRVDPATMTYETVLDRPDTELFLRGTAAIEVGDEIWIGSSRSQYVAVIPRDSGG